MVAKGSELMKEIPLTRGKVALVDDEDYEYLSQFKWFFGGRYAQRGFNKDDGTRTSKGMHTDIMNTPKGMAVDHINCNKLDNRKENLRICEPRFNNRNRGMCKSNTSGYKGVTWAKSNKKWFAQIWCQNKCYYIGYFNDKHEAAKAYNEKAKELHGEYAYLNEIKEEVNQ